MKKLYVVIFVFFLCMIISSCSNNKVQFIYVCNKSFYSLSEKKFLDYVKELDFDIQILDIDNEEAFINYFNNLSKNNIKNKIFVISQVFSDFDISNKDLNYFYLNSNNENVNNLTIDQGDVSYLLGVISGLITRTNNIAIVYSKNLYDYEHNINEFSRGIKQNNLRAYDDLKLGVNVLDTSNFDEESLNVYIYNNIESDIVFNLSDIDIYSDSKLIITPYMKEERFIDIYYDYEKFLNSILGGNHINCRLNVKNNGIKINLNNLHEDLINEFNKHLNKINGI